MKLFTIAATASVAFAAFAGNAVANSWKDESGHGRTVFPTSSRTPVPVIKRFGQDNTMTTRVTTFV